MSQFVKKIRTVFCRCFNSESSSVVEKPPQPPKSAKRKKSFWRRRKPKTQKKSERHQDVLKPGECLTSSAEAQAPEMPKNKGVNTTPAADNSRTKPSSTSADKQGNILMPAVKSSKESLSISADKEAKASASAVTNSTKPPSPSAAKPAWKFLSAFKSSKKPHSPLADKPAKASTSAVKSVKEPPSPSAGKPAKASTSAVKSSQKPPSPSADKRGKASTSTGKSSKKPPSPSADKKAKASTSAVKSSQKPPFTFADKRGKTSMSAVKSSKESPSPSTDKPASEVSSAVKGDAVPRSPLADNFTKSSLSAIVMNTTAHCPGAVKPVKTALSPSSIREMNRFDCKSPPAAGDFLDDKKIKPMKTDTQDGFIGLVNLGLTCYMNCVLQCLANTPGLLEYFLESPYDYVTKSLPRILTSLPPRIEDAAEAVETPPKDIQGKTFLKELDPHNPSGSRGEMTFAFAQILFALWSKKQICIGMRSLKVYSYKNHLAIKPEKLKKLVDKYFRQFTAFQQQDAQEFLDCLLNCLHEELNCVCDDISIDLPGADGHPNREIVEESWLIHKQKENSIIDDIFQGQLVSKITCTECGKVSITCEPFKYLQLTVPLDPNTSTTLSECLFKFTAPEKLDEDAMWFCSQCKMNRVAFMQVSISHLPEVLIIQFKRFLHDGTKLENHVDFPISDLDLTANCLDSQQSSMDTTYDLYAVINHHESSPFNHYTSMAQLPQRSTTKGNHTGWRMFDDHKVKEINENDVCTNEAYVLFYQYCQTSATQP